MKEKLANEGETRMHVGLMFSFRNPPKWKRPWADVYESQLEQAKLAEDLGYDTVWLTEHHFAEDGYSPSLLTLAGAVASQRRFVYLVVALLCAAGVISRASPTCKRSCSRMMRVRRSSCKTWHGSSWDPMNAGA